MIKVNKKINLSQLDKELNGLGLVSNVIDDEIVEVGLADNNTATEKELGDAIKAHKAIDEKAIQEAKRQAILDRIGLTADELKTILG